MAHVGEGYHGLFPEYQNDMDARQIINELLPLGSDAERARVEASMPSLDDRFIKVTRPVDSCIYGEGHAAIHDCSRERDWWYYRIPTDLSRVSDREMWQ